MAWKNLKQLSLADSLTSEHEALTELDDINEIMDWEVIGKRSRNPTYYVKTPSSLIFHGSSNS